MWIPYWKDKPEEETKKTIAGQYLKRALEVLSDGPMEIKKPRDITIKDFMKKEEKDFKEK